MNLLPMQYYNYRTLVEATIQMFPGLIRLEISMQQWLMIT